MVVLCTVSHAVYCSGTDTFLTDDFSVSIDFPSSRSCYRSSFFSNTSSFSNCRFFTRSNSSWLRFLLNRHFVGFEPLPSTVEYFLAMLAGFDGQTELLPSFMSSRLSCHSYLTTLVSLSFCHNACCHDVLRNG